MIYGKIKLFLLKPLVIQSSECIIVLSFSRSSVLKFSFFLVNTPYFLSIPQYVISLVEKFIWIDLSNSKSVCSIYFLIQFPITVPSLKSKLFIIFALLIISVLKSNVSSTGKPVFSSIVKLKLLGPSTLNITKQFGSFFRRYNGAMKPSSCGYCFELILSAPHQYIVSNCLS